MKGNPARKVAFRNGLFSVPTSLEAWMGIQRGFSFTAEAVPMARFDLQGHRGARGLKPENTLPAFEIALDLGITSIETDVHLTRDGIPVLFHDACISEHLCRQLPSSEAPDPATRPLISSLTLAELRGYVADMNPDPLQFPKQDYSVPPLTQLYVEEHGFEAYAIPTLMDLFAFGAAYSGRLGALADKKETQQERAKQVRIDLDLKRVPFRSEVQGDKFDGQSPGRLEQQLIKLARAYKVVERTFVRSFDHRCLQVLRRLEPRLTASVLIANTAPVSPPQLARLANAHAYCPDFEFLDQLQVQQCHAEGVRVVPWTVNDPIDWERLVDWGVDGITTDYPDGLAQFLNARRIAF